MEFHPTFSKENDQNHPDPKPEAQSAYRSSLIPQKKQTLVVFNKLDVWKENKKKKKHIHQVKETKNRNVFSKKKKKKKKTGAVTWGWENS